MPRRVLAVVLNFNGVDLTIRCVEHLRALRGTLPDILVVDNGSTDDSAPRLGALAHQFRLLALPSNRGFAGGMNAGITDALDRRYEYVWLVNSDAFAAPDSLDLLMNAMTENPRLDMVAPRLLSPDGSEQQAGGIVDWTCGDSTPLGAAALQENSQLPDGAWLAGTAPLLRGSALIATGNFEPDFFAYWEDIDLSVRITRSGRAIAAVPAATVLHIGGATSGLISPFAQFLQVRNTWLFLKRNGAPTRSTWMRFLANWIARSSWFEDHGQSARARATLAGLTAARRGVYGAPVAPFEPAFLERVYAKAPGPISTTLARLAPIFT